MYTFQNSRHFQPNRHLVLDMSYQTILDHLAANRASILTPLALAHAHLERSGSVSLSRAILHFGCDLAGLDDFDHACIEARLRVRELPWSAADHEARAEYESRRAVASLQALGLGQKATVLENIMVNLGVPAVDEGKEEEETRVETVAETEANNDDDDDQYMYPGWHA